MCLPWNTPSRRCGKAKITFRILADTAASAIFMYSDTFITVNKATEELTGYSEGELRAMSFYDLLHPEFREMITEHCDALSRGKGWTDALRAEAYHQER